MECRGIMAERKGGQAMNEHPRERTVARPVRRRRRGRASAPAGFLALCIFLLCAVVFAGGFFLGRASAREMAEKSGGTSAGQTQEEQSQKKDTAPESPETVQKSDPIQKPDPWYLTLINSDHLLDREATAPELTEVSGGHQVDSRIAGALEEMLSGARAAGLSPLICSSYRTWDKQEALYEKKVRSCLSQGMDQAQAELEAARWVARPGTSEHQAGLAVDIVDISYQLLDEAQEDTPVQQWLMAHCADYGFILRYPTDKSALTGVAYEPWHYRYVGAEAARAIMDGGLCLEEYLAQ